MRKWTSKGLLGAGLAAVLAFTSACSQEEESSGGSGTEKKTLVVGTDAAYAPFTYMDKGEIVGFDIDIVDAVMEEAGYEYEIKNMGWDGLFESTRQKQLDLAVCAITISDDRKETFDFSSPYYQSTHMIMTKEETKVNSANDLKNMTVGVLNASTGQIAAEKVMGQNSPNLKKYESDAVSIMSMKNGAVQASVADNTVVTEYMKNNPNEKYNTLTDPETFGSEFYGLMFPKGSEVADDLDAALKTIIENGTYAEIYEKWIGTKPDTDVLQKAAQQVAAS
ncbi:basic amino acid ABC transporter substrate-binding protein [Domibacillus sp. 8LH]|uniref:basic amino acid ABC transporter substrate-binding protein n=1 Tax=Domibacillus sp. 8LH TaxID=3073900 RepID=UPI0031724113